MFTAGSPVLGADCGTGQAELLKRPKPKYEDRPVIPSFSMHKPYFFEALKYDARPIGQGKPLKYLALFGLTLLFKICAILPKIGYLRPLVIT